MTKTVEQTLLVNLRQSNIEKPVRHLYDLYFEGVIAHVRLNGGNSEDGADVFQESVLVLIEKVKTGKFRGESSIKTFLLAIARNLWLFELRTRSRRNNREIIYMNDKNKDVELTGSFFEKKNARGLQQVMHEIGETCRKILMGFYYENKSMKELLEQFDYDNEQVLRNRKSKCMKKLKELLTTNSSLLKNLKLFRYMNNNIDIDKLLDDLLKGNLSQTEAEQLMQQKDITDVAGEIDLHRFAAAALQRYSVLEQVQQIHKGYVNKIDSNIGENRGNTYAKFVRMQPLNWFLRVAAILILIAGVWIAYQYNAISSSKLYTEIYQPYYINTDRKDDTKMVTHNLIQQFKDKDYVAVVTTFQSLSTTSNREKFLAAYAWHETGYYKQAIDVLQQILNVNSQTGVLLYNDEAEFYLGLSYLKIKNKKKAMAYFEKINGNTSHTFHERINKWTLVRLKWLT